MFRQIPIFHKNGYAEFIENLKRSRAKTLHGLIVMGRKNRAKSLYNKIKFFFNLKRGIPMSFIKIRLMELNNG